MNLLNERIGPEDLTEDEISEVIYILLDSDDDEDEIGPLILKTDVPYSTNGATTTTTTTSTVSISRENDSTLASHRSG